MGWGLSPLQQQIQRLAWEREQPAPGRTKAQQRLFPQEIFVRVYDWKVTHNRWAPWREPGLAFHYAWHFEPSVIGVKRYHAAMVTVSRALDRLHARGLVKRRGYGGWGLTAHGRTVAQGLMVDKSDAILSQQSTITSPHEGH